MSTSAERPNGDKPVKFLDLGRLHEPIRDRLLEVMDDIIKSSKYILSSHVSDFETSFARAHGLLGGVGVGSGTEALWLALRAAGIGPGHEVVLPAMTFVATAEAVVLCGATPVLADVNDETLLLDAANVEAVRTSSTRAVIPVHLYGHVVNGSAIKQWSDSGLVVIEDCAQSHLARSEGELVGRNSLACAFSFYPGKNLGALGDGGAVLSDDPAFLETIKSLRDHGSLTKYHHDLIGTTSRLDSIQAAVLSVKLEFLSNWNERRRTLAESYREQLSTIDGVRLVPWNEGDVHHLFVVRVDSGKRDLIRQRLSERQIESGIHYPFALSQLPAMRPWARPCPVAENAASELISLPMDPLMSEGDIGRVCRALEQSIAN